MVEIIKYHLAPTALVPNSPRPLLHYKGIWTPPKSGPSAATTSPTAHVNPTEVYRRFTSNGWRVAWIFRYGRTQASHYHSRAHECMAVLSGTATIRFGAGDTSEDLDANTTGSAWERGGVEIRAQAGDVFVIPAGVAHKTYDARPEAEFGLLTPGKAQGVEAEDPERALDEIALSGFTMMGAYADDGVWDFVTAGGDFERVWAVAKPRLDPVFGDGAEGLRRTWPGSDKNADVHTVKL